MLCRRGTRLIASGAVPPKWGARKGMLSGVYSPSSAWAPFQPASGPCPLQASCEYLVEHEALMRLVLADGETWRLRWWRLLDSSTPVLSVVPHTVPLQPLGDDAGLQVWPVPELQRAGAKRRKQQPSKSSSGEEANETEDGEDDELSGGEIGLHEQALLRAEAVQELTVAIPRIKRAARDARQLGQASSAHEERPVADEESVKSGADEEHIVDQPGAAVEVEDIPRQDLEAADPAPPIPVPPVARVPFMREPPAASVTIEDKGSIAFHESKEGFEARCWRHRGCVMSRTAKERRGRPGQGRPLGLLAAWVMCADDASSKAQHTDKAWARATFTYE